MSRRRRPDSLSPTEAANFVGDAREIRRRLIPYLIRLRPQCPAYVAVDEIISAMDRAETEVTGQAPHWEREFDMSGFVDPSKRAHRKS